MVGSSTHFVVVSRLVLLWKKNRTPAFFARCAPLCTRALGVQLESVVSVFGKLPKKKVFSIVDLKLIQMIVVLVIGEPVRRVVRSVEKNLATKRLLFCQDDRWDEKIGVFFSNLNFDGVKL